MCEIPEDIIRIVVKSYQAALSVEERRCLDNWKAAHPESSGYIREIEKYARANGIFVRYRQIDVESAWKEVDDKTAKTAGWRSRRLNSRWWMAAAVTLPLVLGMVLFANLGTTDKFPVAQSVMSVTPGSFKAILELPDGKMIVLHDMDQRDIVNKNGIVLGKDSVNTLVVGTGDFVGMQQSTIRVPRGGEYRLILSDGTKVWVNSGSVVKFPSVFGEKERVVELEGEAYFEVKKDAAHPFIVRTEKSAIRVLGTSFNVCGYRGDDFEQVTLENGAVQVLYRDREYDLLPGEQFEVRGQGASPVVEKVNVALYSSWKEGMFRFQDMPLDELTVKLQRWYNVNFFFENESCKVYRFTGAIRKDVDFNEFISLIESTTNVRFTINPDSIVISEK